MQGCNLQCKDATYNVNNENLQHNDASYDATMQLTMKPYNDAIYNAAMQLQRNTPALTFMRNEHFSHRIHTTR
jgi:hypothetical protein